VDRGIGKIYNFPLIPNFPLTDISHHMFETRRNRHSS